MSTRPAHPVAWTEIPVTDMEKAITFYRAATGYTLTLDETGPNPMAIFDAADSKTGISGHLYPGKPAQSGTGATVHLAVSGSLEDAMERVKQAGGKVVSPSIDIPAGRFAYCLDPDGNSIGLFTTGN